MKVEEEMSYATRAFIDASTQIRDDVEKLKKDTTQLNDDIHRIDEIYIKKISYLEDSIYKIEDKELKNDEEISNVKKEIEEDENEYHKSMVNYILFQVIMIIAIGIAFALFGDHEEKLQDIVNTQRDIITTQADEIDTLNEEIENLKEETNKIRLKAEGTESQLYYMQHPEEAGVD